MSGLIYERTEEQVEIDAEILARVKRGIALLEEKYGHDWYMMIDLDRLKLSSSTRCVLGQIYGDFGQGKEALGLYFQEARDCGFAQVTRTDKTFEEVYQPLQDTWVSVLTPIVKS